MVKSAPVSQIARVARRARLGYADFLYVCQRVRKKLGLTKPKMERELPQLLSEEELKRFFREIQVCGDVQHEIMLKFLFYTAVRVSELVRFRVSDIDLEQCKVFIDQARGQKNRYILFPASFRLVLKSHLHVTRFPPLFVRIPALRGVHPVPGAADYTGPLPTGGHCPGNLPASVPSSDDHLSERARPVGCADSAHLRP
jgi:integrase